MRDPEVQEMRAFLHLQFCVAGEEMDFDVEEAIYWFANDYHGGQGSNLYSALSTSEYHPGPVCTGPEKEGTSADMYAALESEYGAVADLLDSGDERSVI